MWELRLLVSRAPEARRRLVWVLPLCLLWQGCGAQAPETTTAEAAPIVAAARFVGRQECAACHATEMRLWEGSHHDLAMQEANERTVLGDFDDAAVTYDGVTSTFFRRGDGFFVRTDGPSGELTEYEIAYTFGAVPLQQYLIAFPGGRYQALSLCWDTRPADEGGQRWFHLYPDEVIDYEDPLHWTGPQQNWNYMCAECHSTNLQKRFDAGDNTYGTIWSEIDVSCEACHGPGSQHVAWARAVAAGDKSYDELEHMGLAVRIEDPGRGTWMVSPETGNGIRLAPPVDTWEIETCARCHSRRSVISEDYEFARPIENSHRVALLEEGLYHADGQILEEVYVYGSYLQSLMYAKGVTCSDCHDPHTLQLHFPGDAVCFRCHSQSKYATQKHHFHGAGTPGAACVDCHMPPKNYMVVDPRHDHSLRVPRPDLSVQLGTPNACNGCHAEQSNEWSVRWIERWYGIDRRKEWRYGAALEAGRRGAEGAGQQLLRVVTDREMPGIVRATALTLLPAGMPAAIPVLQDALRDPLPIVRRAAARSVESLVPAAQHWDLASHLLEDPVRGVRVDAAAVLAPTARDRLPGRQLAALESAIDEYRATQLISAERPEAWHNLGLIEAKSGRLGEAESAYARAISIDPSFLPAQVNLADLYRLQGRDAEGEQVLLLALEKFPDSGELHHSLGLLMIRQRRVAAALSELQRAVELSPGAARYAYVYGVALYDTGRAGEAFAFLEESVRRFPDDANLLGTLVSFYRQSGQPREALVHARKLLSLAPANPELQRLVAELERSGP